jgi:hypothetical protein
MRDIFELSSGWRSATRVREQSVQSAQSMQPVISADLLSELKASIPLAGKCRREGCVSKRHFAAPGVARHIGSGDIIVREELRG